MREQIVEDETLGTLTWDDDLEWWTGKQNISPGHTIFIAVSPNDEPSEIVLIQARRAFERVRKDEMAFTRAAADRLLALHNEEWNDGPPIDNNAFMERMAMTKFAAYYDGSVEISYADGDLFSGHTIIVSVDKNGFIQDASIDG
jgi:hypothetical protein